MNKFSPFILRIGLGLVFLIFGIGKFTGDIWAETIKAMPFFTSLPLSIELIVILIGLVEIITGLSLIIGFKTRIFAMIASLQLISILLLLKFEEIRDIGLLAAAISLSITGSDFLTINPFKRKHE